MQVLLTILYILLFIFCLSVLVVVHELGHFASAKFFKVFVKEFSIGFGPSLIHKKRKNGETYFSLRAIPFGGYVSMYGEGMEEDPDFEGVDPARKFTALKKWKRIIILFSGVFNNAVLALFLFCISESCFEQRLLYLSSVNIEASSIAADVAKIEDGSSISIRNYSYYKEGKTVNTSYYVVDKDTAYVTYTDDSRDNIYAMIDTTDITFSSRSYDEHLHYYLKDSGGSAVLGSEILANNNRVKSITYNVTSTKGAFKQFRNNTWSKIPSEATANPSEGDAYYDEVNKALYKWNGSKWASSDYDYYGYEVPTSTDRGYVWYDSENEKTPHFLTLNVENGAFQKSGISLFLYKYRNNAGQVVKNTFFDWGNSATAIWRGLASLFTSTESWKDVGGVIAIGQQTTNILQNFGWAKFIYIWGLISVNLAIFNLLPFPGLDGWQIVVLIVEAVAHKEIPDRVKNIVSFIGIALLFSLMILILIKDFIGLF